MMFIEVYTMALESSPTIGPGVRHRSTYQKIEARALNWC